MGSTNYSDDAARPRKMFDDILIRFDTIHQCEGEGQTVSNTGWQLVHSVARCKRKRWLLCPTACVSI